MHSGANQLSGSDYSLVDCNRAGVPLLEVVSEPDMRDGAQAAAYASELRRIVLFMGLTDGVMADGHLRFDVNVSVRFAQLFQFLLAGLGWDACHTVAAPYAGYTLQLSRWQAISNDSYTMKKGSTGIIAGHITKEVGRQRLHCFCSLHGF